MNPTRPPARQTLLSSNRSQPSRPASPPGPASAECSAPPPGPAPATWSAPENRSGAARRRESAPGGRRAEGSPRAVPRGRRSSRFRQDLGRFGEDLAVRRLVASGMTVLARNWRCRLGEVDIVAADGDAVVICEVKTRRESAYEHPMAAVGAAKTARLRSLAEEWVARNGGPPEGGVRIDVVGVLLRSHGAPEVEHVRGVS